MEEKTSAQEAHQYSIQEYLSLGYIYLIILGIAGDVIYYKFLGINILNYSTISDILMAPINTLIADYRVLLVVITMITAIYFLYTWVLPTIHFKNKEKDWYRKRVKNIDKIDEKYAKFDTRKRISLVLIFFTAMFIGIKIGAGNAGKEKIEQGEIKLTHTIVFTDERIERVRILGQNSSFIFYLIQGKKDISITPISGNIREIKIIRKTDGTDL